jgi:hypothetical protein
MNMEKRLKDKTVSMRAGLRPHVRRVGYLNGPMRGNIRDTIKVGPPSIV